MTRVVLEKDGDRYLLSCQGHATGSETLCAAVSCLVFTAAGWMRNDPEIVPLKEKIEPGDCVLAFRGGSGGQSVFRLLSIGFLQLEAAEPERISVDIRED